MRGFLETIFKRRMAIFTIFAVSLCAALIGNYIATPQYQSEAKILVKVGREATLPTTAMTQPLNVFFNRGEQVNTQIQILESRYLVEQAIAALPPGALEEKKPESLLDWVRASAKNIISAVTDSARFVLEAVHLVAPVTPEQRRILDFQNRIDVTRMKETDVIQITFTHPDPALAKLFLETYLRAYLQTSSMAMETPGSLDFFSSQTKEVRGELDKAQRQLIDFRRNWNIYDLTLQKEKTSQELSRIADEILKTDLDVNAAKGKLQDLETSPVADVETVLPAELRTDDAVVELLKSLVQLKVRMSQMTESLGVNHPSVVALRGEMASLRKSLSREVYGILKSQYDALERKKSDLLAQQADLRNTAQILDEKGIEMKGYEDQVDLLTKAFYTYSDKKETSRVNTVMDSERIGSVSVVQPPLSPFKPVSPKRLLNLFLGGLLGLALGVLYAFVMEQLAGTINSPEDMQALLDGTPTIFLPEREGFSPGMRSRAPVGGKPATA